MPLQIRFIRFYAGVFTTIIITCFLQTGKIILHSQEKENKKWLAPYVTTPQNIVEKILELADVKESDIVYDLGCGDARILVTAAKRYGAKGVGVEIDPEVAAKARKNIRENSVDNLVKIIQGDLMTADISEASVVTLFISPTANRLLKSRLEKQLKPGSRVVSHDFEMPGWKPKKTESFYIDPEKKNPFYDKIEDHRLYLWIMGEQK